MSQVILKNLPNTIANREINLGSKSLNSKDRELLIEALEYIEDYLYIANREKQHNIEFVEKKDVLDLISKHK